MIGFLLRPPEVTARYSVPEATLRRWRYEGRGPAYIKLGRNVYYDPADLHEFFSTRRINPRRAS